MKSDTIIIDNHGNGFAEAVKETRKAAQYRELDHKQTLQLQLITEEMLSLIHSVTGEMQASFFLESENTDFHLMLTTKTVMDKEKRYNLLSSSSSGKNEAANSFLGKLRDAFEQALVTEPDHTDGIPDEVANDIYNHYIDDTEWDRYEQSILNKLADDVKISVKGKMVEMLVSKHFE